MNSSLKLKIARALGFAVGVIGGAVYHDIPNELRIKLDDAYWRLDKDLEEIMKEFANE